MTVSAEGGRLKLAGAVDFANADACCEQGLKLLAGMPAEVTVDLGGLESAGTVTVAVLLRWARSVAARNGRLSLAQVPQKCRAILHVSGLAEALPELAAP
jgi:anti-anti-sigma factor